MLLHNDFVMSCPGPCWSLCPLESFDDLVLCQTSERVIHRMMRWAVEHPRRWLSKPPRPKKTASLTMRVGGEKAFGGPNSWVFEKARMIVINGVYITPLKTADGMKKTIG